MDRATGPGFGLAFVRGLRRTFVDALCARFDAEVSIINPGEAYVLGGERQSLEALCEQARLGGASRVGLLPVHVPSHTSRLAPASVEFQAALDAERLGFIRPDTELLSGIDGSRVTDLHAGTRKLAAQVSRTILWSDCMSSCIEAGSTVFLELGPGRGLADIIVGAHPEVQARSLDEFRTLAGVRSWVRKALEK
ncbi:ACP S-malonyltransferase [Lichenifustis flavocetrariae]|nr:hypothetical protein [Lichenifustis flavocetrariae]